ncbi:MAG: thioesterase [Deltaproteobacteria bacterium]|nr:MAG: thioesterase [Deltaproteobacteria bacterium]
MASLNMELVDPVFKTEYRVIYGDTDAAGIVYNANYLRYFEIGRGEMMRAWALSYKEIEALGLVFPVTETYVRFKAPARYDDELVIALSLAEFKRVSCRFHYRIHRKVATGEGPLLVKGFTVHAFVGREGRLTALPEELRERLLPLVERYSGGKRGGS